MLEIQQHEKEKFIGQMSEDSFRELVVRRLFRSLGFEDGRDTCGPEEFGKDAIFFETDKFGIQTFTAVQTKAGNVNLSADPTTNLHTIIAQLRTALSQPHVCVLSKTKVVPLMVYLVASGKINQAARSYISDEIKDPRVRFLDRDDLIAKIDTQVPELWAGITSDLSPYLRVLAARVEDYSSFADSNPINSTVGAFAAASDIRYVDVKLGHQTPIIKTIRGDIKTSLQYQEIGSSELLTDTSPRAIITGDAGSGKSTLLIRLTYLLAKRGVVTGKNRKVPIFFRAYELLDWVGRTDFDFFEIILRKIPGLVTLPLIPTDVTEGRVFIFVDALDEVSKSEDREKIVELLNNFVIANPGSRVILTSRPYGSIERMESTRSYKRFRISPLGIADAEKMLRLADSKPNQDDPEWRREILRRLDGFYGIELNPLLVTIFAVTSSTDKKDIPANITELFSKFTELMLGRWDEKKGLAQQHQSKVKERLISEFAFELQNSGRSEFSRSEFEAYTIRRILEINMESEPEVMVSEILERSGLFRGDEKLEFKHHLIQEYFASKAIPSIEFVKKIVHQDWWRNSIVFYFGSNPDGVSELLGNLLKPSFKNPIIS